MAAKKSTLTPNVQSIGGSAMSVRSVILSSFDEYLQYELGEAPPGASTVLAAILQEYRERLVRFPHSVVLQVAYPEIDFANRWCWAQFGPANGECLDAQSNYPSCDLRTSHSHEGKWMSYWLAKTDYDFGFNQWCFVDEADQKRFLEFIPQINWGESFPK